MLTFWASLLYQHSIVWSYVSLILPWSYKQIAPLFYKREQSVRYCSHKQLSYCTQYLTKSSSFFLTLFFLFFINELFIIWKYSRLEKTLTLSPIFNSINPKIQGPPNEGSLSGYPRFVLCLHITTTTTGKQNIHYDANDVHTINEGEYVNLISRTSLKIKWYISRQKWFPCACCVIQRALFNGILIIVAQEKVNIFKYI